MFLKTNIVSESLQDNETWSECPNCGRVWKEDASTVGLLYRYVLCSTCKQKLGNHLIINHSFDETRTPTRPNPTS